MNLILIKPSEILSSKEGLRVEIRNKIKISHLKNVLKVKEGKILKVGVVNSVQDHATVEKVEEGSITLRLSDKFKANPPLAEKPPIDLVVGIPRPKSLDKLLQLTRERMEQSLLLGLEQGVDTLMPEVEVFQSLGEYERKFASRSYALKLIAHPDALDTLGSLKLNAHAKGPILVAIGPEGGWLDHELEYYARLGFVQFKLTDRILRTEVAAVAILSQLTLLLNDATLRNGLAAAVR
ncbi:uncharacterized protein TOT_040000913 [Theileria orientalis strain Shintoku]|uniref:16S rRNA (uracil(1498)-N(3))-methyltransferase n=1 Tax=Theileria orientalis strain Shintoku TaxID=869250 RepID=J4CDT3_THEOR|nr:uncharacterized protein TOT_040000913 [Theileria orientalis strain Shintoku]BAM41692.1 uncharacterized protein TOT_040000913 [Theileria orientalis strain Shintoku]|eukprot:XP_009691993.1 uncharacterized protein TOT_040000913 [Theileria orientalis strain Shintoku]